jgi:hypothetical protein
MDFYTPSRRTTARIGDWTTEDEIAWRNHQVWFKL